MPAVTLHATTATTHIHSYTSTLTAPTCTEPGYTTYTCDCGESYADDYVDATGHKRTNGICTGCGCAFADIADLSGDGKITVFDAQLLMEALSGLRTLTGWQWQALGDLTPDDILDHILGRPCDD